MASQKVVDKELLHCLAFAYIQKYSRDTLRDFQVYMTGYRMAKTIVLYNAEKITKGTAITQKIIEKLNTHNQQKKVALFDMDVMEKIPSFRPAAQFMGANNTLGAHFNDAKLTKYLLKIFIKKGTKKFEVLGSLQSTKAVFDSMKKLCVSSLIGNATSYVVLSQSDPFVSHIKDNPLKQIKSALKFPGAVDLLNPSDFYIVAKQSIPEILKEIDTHIINADDQTILDNMRKGQHTYRTIINKYFGQKKLYGVSSKILSTSTIETKFKIVGTTSLGKTTLIRSELSKNIDPYTRLLKHIIDTPSNMSSIIDEVITIDYRAANLRAISDIWVVPVHFNFNQFDDIGEKIITFQLEFLAEAGYNGKYIKTDTKINTPWVGGIQNKAVLADMFFTLYEDGFATDAFIKKRLASVSHPDLVKFLSNKTFISPKNVISTFEKYGFDRKMINKFFVESATNLLGEYGRNISEFTNLSPLAKQKSFNKAQHSFFLTEPTMKQIVKKKIFLSIYGIATKKGYFAYTDNQILPLITKQYTEIMKNVSTKIPPKVIQAEFSAAPYLLVGSLI